MQQLLCHPATPSAAIRRIGAEARWLAGGRLGFYYVLEGEAAAVRLPPGGRIDRVDKLWRHTCCEAFVAGSAAGAYSEFNFSPSGAWAAYQFTDYRERMKPVAVVADPTIEVRTSVDRIELDAIIGSRSIPVSDRELKLGLAVVVEDRAGSLSYWALAHSDVRPDFHRADSFRFSLAPAF